MRKFDHLEAINYLLEMNTGILTPEHYYPWYMHTKGILINGTIWFVLLCILSIVWLALLNASPILLLSIVFISTTIAGIIYGLLFRNQIKEAKHKAIQVMMRLEKQAFMAAIEPFVTEDHQAVVARIIKYKDFKANEYASVTLATKSRILFNTEAFIQDIERMVQESPKFLSDITDEYSEHTFKVTQKSIDNYQQKQIDKESGTFSELFSVPDELRQSIISRVKQAAANAHADNSLKNLS